MGRTYAGILGPLAFLAVLIRGWRSGWPYEGLLLSAWLSFVAMAAIGYLVGRLAEWIVDESVQSRIVAELAAREAARKEPSNTGGA